MKKNLYILSVVTSKKVTLEYRFVEEKRDMRKAFFIFYDKDIYNGSIAELFENIQIFEGKVKGDRLIMKNGANAYAFQKWIKTNK